MEDNVFINWLVKIKGSEIREMLKRKLEFAEL